MDDAGSVYTDLLPAKHFCGLLRCTPDLQSTYRPPIKKGIDAAVAAGLMRLAFRRRYGALVLFSSGTGLLPALAGRGAPRTGRP